MLVRLRSAEVQSRRPQRAVSQPLAKAAPRPEAQGSHLPCGPANRQATRRPRDKAKGRRRKRGLELDGKASCSVPVRLCKK